LQEDLAKHANGNASVSMPVIAAFGNALTKVKAAHDIDLSGEPTIAAMVFEEALDTEAVAQAKELPFVVTSSRWNERLLRAYGLERVRTVPEGVDPSYFHPASRLGLFKDRFAIFSGGKAELRKGQDLVLAAFRIFAARHAEAILVTAWHSPWPELAQSLDCSGIAAPVVLDAEGRLDVRAWAAASGVPAERVGALTPVANVFMPAILREMDVAVFPNRAEAATNLVAMECMACAVPVILSGNTGHLDLIEGGNCFALDDQRQAPWSWPGVDGVPGWGESQVDEVVEKLEQAFADRTEARRRATRGAQTLAARTWAAHAQGMKEVVRDVVG
jgi:glycosyltransferase involved in cell wall biosynthesis